MWFDRRELIKGAIAGAGALALPAATLAQEGPRKGGPLRLAMPYNPAALDPMTGRNLPDLDTLYAVFDALIDFEPETLELKPGLAKSWSFTDPKTLVLELVDGVNFHDGTPFNAEAVKFNLDRYKNDPRSNVKADLGTVESVEVTGQSQVTLKLNRPNAGLPAILTNRIGLIVSPKSIQDKGGNVDRTPVGTGPFKFVELAGQQQHRARAATRTTGEKGLPYLDGIDIRIINELNTAVRAVVAGEADLAINLQAPQKVIADRSPNVVADGDAVARALRRVPELRPPAARRRARAAGAELRDQSRRDQQDRRASASASRRARSCRRSTGPAIRRRRISIPTIRRRRRSCSPRRAIRTGSKSRPSAGPISSPCSARRSSSPSSPRSASASS